MRLMISPSKNAKSFYVIKSVQKNGKNTSEIVEKLGTETFIKETYGVDDAEAWARSHVNELNAAEKAAKDVEHFVRFSTNELIPAGKELSFNAGYLFLQKIYSLLGLPSICKKIKKDNAFTYDLNAILSRLVYGRILFPSSKLSCFEQSKELLEQTEFDLHLIYRALSVLADNSDFIQAELYKRSKSLLNVILVFYFMTARITFLNLSTKMD